MILDELVMLCKQSISFTSQRNPAILMILSNSMFQWSTSGGKLHSKPQLTRVDSYHVLLHVATTPANEVAVDVTYVLRCCSTERKIGFYVLGTSGSISIPPSPMQYSFRHVADITNTSVMRDSGSMKFTTRIYVTVPDTYLYIAFRSRGFYGTLEDLKLYYFKCPAVVANFVSYPEKIAPTRDSVALVVIGTCVHQSLPNTKPKENVMVCYANGTSETMGGCQCIAGYKNTSFSSCSGNYFERLHISHFYLNASYIFPTKIASRFVKSVLCHL